MKKIAQKDNKNKNIRNNLSYHTIDGVFMTAKFCNNGPTNITFISWRKFQFPNFYCRINALWITRRMKGEKNKN